MTPMASLDQICGLAMEAQVYKDCVRYYPFAPRAAGAAG